jgi:predicted nucleic acid-binding protein
VTAVVDTSPLCYLVLIREIEILPRLFTRVAIPRAVRTELLHEHAPSPVRIWATDLPSWLSLYENPGGITPDMANLQAGEQAAILLAESLNAETIVLDEKSARRVAASRGLQVTGTLGVLGEAGARELIDLLSTIDRLGKTTFRCSPALLKGVLDRFGGL